MALLLREQSQLKVEPLQEVVVEPGLDKSLGTLVTAQRQVDIALVRQGGTVPEGNKGRVPRHIKWLARRNKRKSARLLITTAWLSRIDSIAPFLVKLGLVFVFSYAAITMSLQPESYTYYLPSFLREIYDPKIELHVFGVFELFLSAWLLLGDVIAFLRLPVVIPGKLRILAALFAFLTIFALTVVNLESFSVVFRNVSIIFSALALVFMEWKSSKRGTRSKGDDIRARETEKVIVDAVKHRDTGPLSEEALTIAAGKDLQSMATEEVIVGNTRRADTEPLSEEALTIVEEQLVDDDLDIAVSLNKLALLYHGQGKYAEAEQLYRRVLTIQVKRLGANHPDTATSFYNLAVLYHSQGKYGATEVLYRRVLAIREQHLGDDHPDTVQCLNNLAKFYHERGRDEDAEPLFRRAFSIRELALEQMPLGKI